MPPTRRRISSRLGQKKECSTCRHHHHHHHWRIVTGNSLGKVKQWPRKWQPTRSSKDSTKARQLPGEAISENGSRPVAANSVEVAPHTAPDPAIGQSNAPANNAVGAVGDSQASSLAGSSVAASSNGSATSSSSSSGSNGTSPSSSNSSSSSNTHGSSAPHGVPLGALVA
jgi:hypothetical protein